MKKEEKLIQRLQDKFNMSFIDCVSIYECVDAFDKYEGLPQASKNVLQLIADKYEIILEFDMLKGSKKLVLVGATIPCKLSSYLYTDNTIKLNSKLRKKEVGRLLPHANNRLEWVSN